MTSFTIFVNNKAYQCVAGTTLSQLPDQLDWPDTDLALAVNQNIIHRPQWSQIQLSEGDKVDAFTLVAGG
ncbi:sulfur carrier protein ThiS [Alteromonas lipotrueiana]|uniref:sulfur carrier protein ThiS n=1 Tax=Alteromonas lipotrueiana TaxID=2803815 RepID=UPI001C443CB0|nr:sulfur carrier protein ThiS [Alteromonas lipotrueiana]|tara:strand:+ start:288 stop:497 length:210 start_codon:yes stop_codon:yes gene_type:complete